MIDNDTQTIEAATCCSRAVLDIIANKWTIIIMHALQDGTKRYGQLNRAADNITQKMLTETLRKLERDGIVERVVYPVVPPKVEYKLTPLGHEVLSLTETMANWADTHFQKIEKARSAYDERAVTDKSLLQA